MLLFRREEAGVKTLFALPVEITGGADSPTVSPTIFPTTVWVGALTGADSVETLSPLKRALLLLLLLLVLVLLYPSDDAVAGTRGAIPTLIGRSVTLDVAMGTGRAFEEFPTAPTQLSISTAKPSIMLDITWYVNPLTSCVEERSS